MILSLVMILSAKEFFTIHVEGLSQTLGITVSDTWLLIFAITVFAAMIITWFFTSIKIERKR